MHALIIVLFWLHFIGIAMGLGGGIALSQIIPRLVAAPPAEREALDTLQAVMSRVTVAGLVLLLITGPLLLWLRFGSFALMPVWFWIKMLFVATLVIGVFTNKWAARRFGAGESRYVSLMVIGGRFAGVSAVLAMLFAVMAFN